MQDAVIYNMVVTEKVILRQVMEDQKAGISKWMSLFGEQEEAQRISLLV